MARSHDFEPRRRSNSCPDAVVVVGSDGGGGGAVFGLDVILYVTSPSAIVVGVDEPLGGKRRRRSPR